MLERGRQVVGVRFVDGDASTATALTLYEAGTQNEVEVSANESLTITDITITDEAGGDIYLDQGTSKNLYDLIFAGNLAANGGYVPQFEVPYQCRKGVIPKFTGSSDAAKISFCKIHGFITEA